MGKHSQSQSSSNRSLGYGGPGGSKPFPRRPGRWFGRPCRTGYLEYTLTYSDYYTCAICDSCCLLSQSTLLNSTLFSLDFCLDNGVHFRLLVLL